MSTIRVIHAKSPGLPMDLTTSSNTIGPIIFDTADLLFGTSDPMTGDYTYVADSFQAGDIYRGVTGWNIYIYAQLIDGTVATPSIFRSPWWLCQGGFFGPGTGTTVTQWIELKLDSSDMQIHFVSSYTPDDILHISKSSYFAESYDVGLDTCGFLPVDMYWPCDQSNGYFLINDKVNIPLSNSMNFGTLVWVPAHSQDTIIRVTDIFLFVASGSGHPGCGGGGTGGSGVGTGDLVSADMQDNHISLAWNDTSSHALKQAFHPSPQKNIGSGSSGWISTNSIEASNTHEAGICYLPSRVVHLSYTLSGTPKYRLNRIQGYGAAGDWSSSITTGFGRATKSGRAQNQTFRFRALGDYGSPLTAGDIQFSQCRDGQGNVWVNGSTVTTGARGPFCGGGWLGNGYGCLYTRNSDANIFWTFTPNPDSWASATVTNTGKTGTVASATVLPNGIIVGLVWDWDGTTGAKTCKALRSRDRGLTWEIDGSAISALPAMNRPPVLVHEAHYVYAVYVSDAGNPGFACSVDGGLTWN